MPIYCPVNPIIPFSNGYIFYLNYSNHSSASTVHFSHNTNFTTLQNQLLHTHISLSPLTNLSLSLFKMVTADNNSSSLTVQHVTKKSSDELLRKFAETSDGAKKLELATVLKRRKTRRDLGSGNLCESPSYYKSSSSLAERRSLLPPAPTRKSLLLRQLGIGRLQLKARDTKNRSILASIDKTWRKTVEGASKVFLEKHYNRHRRLINDMI